MAEMTQNEMEDIASNYKANIDGAISKVEDVLGLRAEVRGLILNTRPVVEVCDEVFSKYNTLTNTAKQSIIRKATSNITHLRYLIDRVGYYNIPIVSFEMVERIQKLGAVYDGAKRLRLRSAFTNNDLKRQRLYMFKQICSELESINRLVTNDTAYRILRLICIFITIGSGTNLSVLVASTCEMIEIYKDEYEKKLSIREVADRATNTSINYAKVSTQGQQSPVNNVPYVSQQNNISSSPYGKQQSSQRSSNPYGNQTNNNYNKNTQQQVRSNNYPKPNTSSMNNRNNVPEETAQVKQQVNNNSPYGNSSIKSNTPINAKPIIPTNVKEKDYSSAKNNNPYGTKVSSFSNMKQEERVDANAKSPYRIDNKDVSNTNDTTTNKSPYVSVQEKTKEPETPKGSMSSFSNLNK